MSGLTFILLTFLTFYLIWAFYYGYKKNINFSRKVSELLEEIFSPKEKSYTWLGGAIGFRALYKVKDKIFRQIVLNLRLQPRQSFIYYLLKKIILKGIKDNLQILFFLKKNINFEFHLIQKGFSPKIFNKNLQKIEKDNYIILFSENIKKQVPLLEKIFQSNIDGFIKHIAITPDRNVIYYDIHFDIEKDFGKLKNALKSIFLDINNFFQKL